MRFLRYVSALAVVVASATTSFGQSSQVIPQKGFPPIPVRRDFSKGGVEIPLKSILAGTKQGNTINLPVANPYAGPNVPVKVAVPVKPAAKADRGKTIVEIPTKAILAGTKIPAPVPVQPKGQPVDEKDLGKKLVERPSKVIIRETGPTAPNVDQPGNPTKRATVDVGKGFVEGPAKVIVRESGPPEVPVRPVKLDIGKRDIEFPAKEVLAKAKAAVEDKNPTVAPGKVKWHPSFEAARAASAKSGKPVLLFQMMGDLDKRFC